MKHIYKCFKWAKETYDASCGISEKLTQSSKLGDKLYTLMKEEYDVVYGVCAHVPTRCGSMHLVLMNFLRNEKALQVLTSTDEWKVGVKGAGQKSNIKKAHELLTCADETLFDGARLLEELLSPVMHAIHTLAADQAMLPYLRGLSL
jgi:hypothetical protein